MRKISKKSIKAWNLESGFSFLITNAIVITVFYFFKQYDFISKVCYFIFAVSTFLFVKDLVLNPLRFKNTNYLLENEIMYTKEGSISIKETTIPLKRIQHVDIEQSFYSRLFNLYKLNIYTAGDSHNITFLDKTDAELLKGEIVEYIANMGVDVSE